MNQMTDQERLAEIKAQYHILTRNGYDLGAWDEPFSWLIERVQELENLKNAFDDLDSDYIDLQQENRRYREALESILNNDQMYITNQEIILKTLEKSE